jgi:hypothetical protein
MTQLRRNLPGRNRAAAHPAGRGVPEGVGAAALDAAPVARRHSPFLMLFTGSPSQAMAQPSNSCERASAGRTRRYSFSRCADRPHRRGRWRAGGHTATFRD